MLVVSESPKKSGWRKFEGSLFAKCSAGCQELYLVRTRLASLPCRIINQCLIPFFRAKPVLGFNLRVKIKAKKKKMQINSDK